MSNLHLSRHEELYKALRELISDYISTTRNVPTTVTELVDWSKSQIKAQWTDMINADIDCADVHRHLKQETVV